MKTSKIKIKNGYKVTREDGATFRVRKISLGGKSAVVIENEKFETVRAGTFAAAFSDISGRQSSVTGWQPK